MKRMCVLILLLLALCMAALPAMAEMVVDPFSVPSFTKPDEAKLTLDEMGIPLEEIIDSFPHYLGEIYMDNQLVVYIAGVDSMDCVTKYDQKYYLLTHHGDGTWTVPLDVTEEQFLEGGTTIGAHYHADSWSLYYENGKWAMLEYYSKMIYIDPDQVEVVLIGSDYSTKNYYSTKTGSLQRQRVAEYYTYETYAEYTADGELVLFQLADLEDPWYVFDADGWSVKAEDGTLTPCDVPAGYEHVTADWVKENFPIQLDIPQPEPEPEPDDTPAPGEESLPDLSQYINLPGKYYYDFSKMGVDAESMWNAVPQTSGAYKDGDTLYVPDRGYKSVQIISPEDSSSWELDQQDGVWVTENYAYDVEDTFFFAYDNNVEISYEGNSLYEVKSNRVRLDWNGEQRIEHYENDVLLWVFYRKGVMDHYELLNDTGSIKAYYEPDGTLTEARLGKLSDGMYYRWGYRRSWHKASSSYGSYVNCAAPAEYANASVPDVMAEMFGTITVEGVPAKPAPILPEAVAIDVPAAPAALPLSLSQLGIDLSAFPTTLPNSAGVEWVNGQPVIKDRGYDAVSVSDTWGYDFFPMVKEDGCWVVADGTEPDNPFYEGYCARITIGDVMYEFDEEELLYLHLGDFLRTNAGYGRYWIDLVKKEGECCGVYDADGNLEDAEYFPHWTDQQVFFHIRADDSIYYVLTTPNWAKVYYWFPDLGWRVGNWSNNVACDAPDYFADVTDVAQWCYDARDRLLYGEDGAPEIVAPAAYVNTLPADLTVIEAEAFLNSDITDCDIPAGVTTIGAAAFKRCVNLTFVRIPETVTVIASGAFEGSPKVVIVCEAGSTAESFAKAQGITCITE